MSVSRSVSLAGNQKVQHIVRYPPKVGVKLVMFLIVDHNSIDSCIPPEVAFRYFQEFGFTHVEGGVQTVGEFSEWPKFNEALFEEYNKITSATFAEAGEG
jgi:hypothetical protein